MKSPLIFPSDTLVHPSFQVLSDRRLRAVCNHYFVDKLFGEGKFSNSRGRVALKKQNPQVLVGHIEPHETFDTLYRIKYLWLHYKGYKGL